MNRILSIKVLPDKKKIEIKQLGEDHYEICLDAPPEKGKANLRLIEVLSEYFDIPESSIIIIRGHKTRNKIVKIST